MTLNKRKKFKTSKEENKLNFLPQVIHDNIWYGLKNNFSGCQDCGLL